MFIAVLLTCITINLNAQFSKSSAINLVLNTILAGDTVSVDVFVSTDTLAGYIEFIDTDTSNCPYPGNWVFFIDDNPFSGWYHNCRYIFVNSQNGNYIIKPGIIYPKNQSTGFELISEAARPTVTTMTAGNQRSGIQPNDNYFAVIVCVQDNQANWNDVSLVYNTLTQEYGYKKENIFVHYGTDGTSSTTYLNDLDDDDIDDLDYPAQGVHIHATFEELAGITSNNNDIPELLPQHQLAVFFTDAVILDPYPTDPIWAFWTYIENYGYYLDVEGPSDLASKMEGIKCSQMTMAFSCNSGEGIADYFIDINYPVVCKNRHFHISSGMNEKKFNEQYITGGNYSEYLYYWAAAARGVYPVTDYPWVPSQTETGDFQFELISGFGNHPDDYDPDTDGDGYVQMEEAFLYADDQDTWSDYGYTNPYTPGQSENPDNWDLLPFSEDLLTLAGLAGNVENTQTIENRSYIIGGLLEIEAGSSLSFEDGTSLYHINENAELKNASGALLSIGNNMKIYGNLPNKVTVNGNIQVGTGVTFEKFGSGSPFYGLELNNHQLTTNLDLVTFNEARLHNYGAELNITNSNFIDSYIIYSHRGDINVSNSVFDRTWLYIENIEPTQAFTATISDNNFSTNYTMVAIDLWDYDNFFIHNNTIDGYYNGIQLAQSGGGLPNNQSIFGNEIYNCTMSGIHVFNSSATLASNHIYDNEYGLRLHDNSNIALVGNVNAQDYSEMNYITDNSSYEIYTSAGSFPWYFRFNAIIDEDNVGNPTDPMVYAELPGSSLLFDVKYNCWTENNNFSPSADLYPSNYLVYPTYCPPSGGHKSTELALEDFQEGLEQFENEEYEDAKTTFESVIDSYAETQYSSASMKELLELEKFLESDYSALQTYYETNDSIQADSVLSKLAIFLANKCEIEMENWQNAIDHFEYVIENPDTPEDSIFAIIDLGYTYFLMENSESRSTALGRLIEHKPDNFEAFAEKRDYLLSLLPFKKSNDKPEIEIDNQAQNKVFQNVPNPFTNSTNVHFNLTVSSNVVFNIYDNIGKLVKVIDAETKPKGQHKVEIDMKGFPKGIYFYSMYVNGQLADSKKMIVK